MTLKILIADDHIMISKGLRRSLEYDFGYRDIYSVTSCSELLGELKRNTYTHLILDIGLSDGSTLEIIPTIQSLYPELEIMIFSAKPAEAFERAFRHLKIRSYLSKEAGEEESNHRLRQFFGGRYTKDDKKDKVENPFGALTDREMVVLHYLLKGTSTNEIASSLNLKHNTVSSYKNKIFEKTATNNIKDLIDLAGMYKIVV